MAATTRELKVRRLWLAFVAIVISLLLWVNQTVRSTQLSYRIQNLEDEIRKENARQVSLKRQRDAHLSLENVEQVARKKLGLIAPKEEDIIVIIVPPL